MVTFFFFFLMRALVTFEDRGPNSREETGFFFPRWRILERRGAEVWGMRWPGRGDSNLGEQSQRRRRGRRISGNLGDFLPAPSRQVRRRPRLRIAALHRKGTHRTRRRTARHGGAGATPRWPGGADTARRRGPHARCPAPRPAPCWGLLRKGVGADAPRDTQPCFPAGAPAPGRQPRPVAERGTASARQGLHGGAAGRVRPRGRRWGAAVWVPGLDGDGRRGLNAEATRRVSRRKQGIDAGSRGRSVPPSSAGASAVRGEEVSCPRAARGPRRLRASRSCPCGALAAAEKGPSPRLGKWSWASKCGRPRRRRSPGPSRTRGPGAPWRPEQPAPRGGWACGPRACGLRLRAFPRRTRRARPSPAARPPRPTSN